MDEADKAMHVLFEVFSKPMKPFKGIGPPHTCSSLLAGEPVFRRELGIGGSKINTEIFRMRASRNEFQFDLRKEIPCNDSRKMVVHCMQGKGRTRQAGVSK